MARTANSARKSIKKEEPIKSVSSQSKTDSRKGDENDMGAKKTVVSRAPSHQEKSFAEKRPAKSLSVTTPRISQKEKPLPKKTSKNIIREIKYYQNNIGFLIPRAVLVRTVRQALLTTIKQPISNDMKFTSVSLNVLHEALENHLVCIIELDQT